MLLIRRRRRRLCRRRSSSTMLFVVRRWLATSHEPRQHTLLLLAPDFVDSTSVFRGRQLGRRDDRGPWTVDCGPWTVEWLWIHTFRR